MTWQPGQSGNPNGAPKRAKLWKDAIIRAIKRREETDPQALEKLADKLIAQVELGDVGAIKEFGDRVDGRVAQAIIGDDSEDPVSVRNIITGVPRASDD
jgi:hypothetical protein